MGVKPTACRTVAGQAHIGVVTEFGDRSATGSDTDRIFQRFETIGQDAKGEHFGTAENVVFGAIIVCNNGIYRHHAIETTHTSEPERKLRGSCGGVYHAIAALISPAMASEP